MVLGIKLVRVIGGMRCGDAGVAEMETPQIGMTGGVYRLY